MTSSGWSTAGLIKPVIDKPLPLEEAAAAHQRVMDAQPTGRLVLMP